ncbi:DUF975 family protein [Levilactobacillus koreensis]|uniref:Integral membrane protein n=1 Tax=Levilactobacillus koreensis TaxID=637971 RepID=A0AAC8UU69_9LACO|nr:DUF975 family protein [Levilactobacillus koreensis]AKP64031.1 integral membrane protein [Levilactobacillus koreensis]
MDSQDRVNLKMGAKRQVLDHYKFYVLLSILWLALWWIGDTMYTRDINLITRINEASSGWSFNSFFSFAGIFFIVASMLHVGTQLTMIDLDRATAEMDNPIQRSFALFDKGQYFLGWMFICIFIGIFTFLWSLLLFFPGIIKAYSYSQAFYIYRDAYDRGENITALEAITRSREMMNGYKSFLFIMDLSFILWFILGGITFGLAFLFVMPYYDLARAKFYNQLVWRQTENRPHVMDDADASDDEGSDESDSEL